MKRVLDFLDASFWKDVATGTISGVLVPVILFTVAQIPAVYEQISRLVIQYEAARKDPKIIAPLAQQFLREGNPEKALAISQELASMGNDFLTMGKVGKSYQQVFEIRQNALAQLNQPGTGQATLFAKGPNSPNAEKLA